MEPYENPELIDWDETIPPNSRAFGFLPIFALGSLSSATLLSVSGGNFNCKPRWRDYYTCSPRYICYPRPY